MQFISLYLYKQSKLETFVTEIFPATFLWFNGH